MKPSKTNIAPIFGNTPDKRYLPFVKSTTVEERLTRIEREFDELKHEVLGLKPRAKGWRQTVGAIPDDELSRSAEELGSEWPGPIQED